MRLIRPLAPALALIGSIALTPAQALAVKHSNRSGRCKISINVAPRLIETGEASVVFGRLTCRGRAAHTAAFRTVRLYARVPGFTGFHAVQLATTDARGFYELVRSGVENTTAYYVSSHGAASGQRSVRVLAHVTLNAPPDGAELRTGFPNRMTFSGNVTPRDAGALVVLQRQNALSGDEWHRIDLGVVRFDGSYSITHAFVVPGDANIRVLVRSQRRNVPSPSEARTYEISQAENPHLTISSSQNPITYGQSAAISGTLAGGANTPVTLLARTALQRVFVPVAEARTDGSGNYAFPPQAPVVSTSYQVRGAGRTSAVLYEGVRDLLTAQLSAISAAAGHALTFSGAVAPNHTGHVIYLERRDRIGAEFHVVQVAFVGPGSTYRIEHTVYEPGTKVFRIKIPGGPENGGAVSAPFTVQVTPGPASSLRPEPSTNSTLPQEGQI